MNASHKIRAMLADDHPVVMRGFALALEELGIAVVAQAKNAEETCAMFNEVLPDVLILDVRFGHSLTGIDVAKKILSKHPAAKIVFLSQFDQEALIKEAYRLGGRAFLTKSCYPSQLAEAVSRAYAGEVYFLPEIAERLANIAIQGEASPQSLLEARELDIFTLMARGLTNVEIATELNLSSKTISNTSQAIKDKLGIHRQADITLLAVKWSLVAPS